MNYDEAHKLRRPLERHELEHMFTYYVGAVTDDVLHHIETPVLQKILCHVLYKKLREEKSLEHRYAILRLHRIFGMTERVLYKWFKEHRRQSYRQVFLIII